MGCYSHIPRGFSLSCCSTTPYYCQFMEKEFNNDTAATKVGNTDYTAKWSWVFS